jgi:hypothetical protein
VLETDKINFCRLLDGGLSTTKSDHVSKRDIVQLSRVHLNFALEFSSIQLRGNTSEFKRRGAFVLAHGPEVGICMQHLNAMWLRRQEAVN